MNSHRCLLGHLTNIFIRIASDCYLLAIIFLLSLTGRGLSTTQAKNEITFQKKITEILQSTCSKATKINSEEWSNISSKLSDILYSKVKSNDFTETVDFLVSKLGNSPCTNICISLSAPDVFIITANSGAPYADINVLSVPEEYKKLWIRRTKVESQVTQSIVQRMWRDSAFLKEYTIFSYWCLFGSQRLSAEDQLKRINSMASRVHKNMPKPGAPGYFWYIRKALFLICLTGDTELLKGHTLQDIPSVYSVWYDNWNKELNKVSKRHDSTRILSIMSPKRLFNIDIKSIFDYKLLESEVEARGYTQLEPTFPMLLILLSTQ